MAIYNYQRVSTKNQNFGRQESLLNKLGIKFDKVYEDKTTGKGKDRPELNKLMLVAEEGDQVYIESISRLGRDVDDLRYLCNYFNEKGVTIYFLKEGINTSGEGYKFLLTVLGAVAEMEREILVQRVQEGVERCKETGETRSGKWFGRQEKTVNDLPKNFFKWYSEWKEGKITAVDFAKIVGVSRSTIYRYIDIYKKNQAEASI